MSAAHELRLTPAEYLAIEREAERKSEYHDGRMYLMSGASEAHVLITMNVSWELGAQLRDRPCRVYASDMRLKVTTAGLYTYPDVMAACGDIRLEDARRDTLLNPSVIIEVLSPSTAAYDRGRKFALYRELESLQEYVLISQDEHRVERFARQADSRDWLQTVVTGLDGMLELPSIACRLHLSEVYRKVELSCASTSADDRIREPEAPYYAEPGAFPGMAG
ncbi:MAG: Uma2 family endonuclease [Actinomycetota bacterium]